MRRPIKLKHFLPILFLFLLTACASNKAFLKGEELAQVGNWDEAVRYYIEAVAKDPTSVEAKVKLLRAMAQAAEAHYKRGTELEKEGRIDEAFVEYNSSLAYNPEQVHVKKAAEKVANIRRSREHLAKAKDLIEKGNYREAAKELSEALQLDPENREAKETLEQASQKLKEELELARKERERAEEGKALSLFSRKPVTFRFKDTDIKDVLEIIAKLADVNVFIDEAVTAKKITTFFKDMPLREAFGLILTTNRLFAKRMADNTVIVSPDTPAKHVQYDDLMVQTFYLSTAEAKVAVNLLRAILNTRHIFVNEKLNALVVRDTPEKIELARRLLEANDRGGAEVEIELEVLEVNRDKLQELGITFTDRFNVILNLGARVPGATTTATTTTVPIRDLYRVWPYSTLTYTNPALTLNLVKSESDTKTLANPTIRVLDRQKARVLIGERRPITISTIVSTPAGAQPTAPGGAPVATTAVQTTETRVEYRDVGLKLTITPTIHLDREITVDLNFEISSVGVEAIPGQPVINTRNIDTFIKLKDGETRLLGGLIQDDTTKTVKKFPFLSDLPVLGRLFTNIKDTRIQRDIIISLTPRLVKTIERPESGIESFWSGTGEAFTPEPPIAIPPPTPGVPPPTPPPTPVRPPGPMPPPSSWLDLMPRKG
ncbi:MAG: tetratricopeptide repeat protein [candidate division NC10 bacterium]|nr:tetratricopeptide repeat protein [candidate division NC10 bacterium]